MDKKLVSVITPTWHRTDLLLAAIGNVRAQTYRPIEHVIVSDGPDPELAEIIAGIQRTDVYPITGNTGRQDLVKIRFVELGRNWTGVLTDSYGVAPMMVGQLLARGEYHTWLADDQRMAPVYLEKAVARLEQEGVDFVYPLFRFYQWQAPDQVWELGSDPPRLSEIASLVYRADMIEKAKGPYRSHIGRAADWDFVDRAMQGGATWSCIRDVLFTCRDDNGCSSDQYAAQLPEHATW